MTGLAFGDFELDEAGRTLRLRGKPVAVQPLVLSLLGYLVRHAGRVVPKQELLDALWPGLYVTEASLQRAASLARSALKAGGLESSLRSVPRFGYRFALDQPSLSGIGTSEKAPISDLLLRARQAAEARDWAVASEQFARADEADRLNPADIDFWAYTLECQGRNRAAAPLYLRSVEGHVGGGAPHDAARSAVRLAKIYFELGNTEASRAWIARADELLGPDGPPDIQAYRLWMQARLQAFDGDLEASLATSRRAVELAEAGSSIGLRALAIAYEGFYHMTLGDLATGRARQDQAAATGLSHAVDPLTGSLIYCSILWTCRTFADWSRAAQWAPGFEIWSQMAFADVTAACRLHSADVLASVGQLTDALREIDLSIQTLTADSTWELGDAYRVRADIHAMMGQTEAAHNDYQVSISMGWDVEPGLARLQAQAGDVASAIAALDRSLGRRSWYGRQRRGWLLANKAQIAARAGLSDVATSDLAKLDGLGDAARVPAVQAMMIEARAELDAGQGKFAEAIHELEFARELWIDVRHAFHAARLHLRLADLMELSSDSRGADLARGAARLMAERIGAGALLSQQISSAA